MSMNIKTEITSSLDENTIKNKLSMIVEKLQNGFNSADNGEDLKFYSTVYDNGMVIRFRENAYNPVAEGRYDSYSWGMFVVDKEGMDYYQLTDDNNNKTLSDEEYNEVISKLGQEIPKEKKKLFSNQTVINPNYANAFKEYADLTAEYYENTNAKTM